MSALSITTWLIIINIAVFLLDPILLRASLHYVYPYSGPRTILQPLYGLGHFSLYLAIGKLEIWRFITFQFIHANRTHLLFNMLGLFFFGPLVETYLGRKRFIAFYLLCGAAGPVAYLLLWSVQFLIADAKIPLVGASAGIFGILIAGAQIAPNTTVYVWGILPMQLKTLAWVLLAIAVYVVLKYGSTGQANAGGEAAHLGGAAVGFLLMRYPNLLRIPRIGLLQRRRPF